MYRPVVPTAVLLVCSLLVGFTSLAPKTNTPPKSEAGPAQKTIVRTQPVSHLAMDVQYGKYYVRGTANDMEGQFIFDTGSPTILSAQFAQKIGLKPVGRNRGVDANGTPLTMDIAILPRLALGHTVFQNVPVLIYDFSGLEMGRCIIGDGVLGSELLPGSAWRIDRAAGQISIAATAKSFSIKDSAARVALYDTGYPHLPIVDYRVGDIAEKALFDTGNSERVVLFKPVANRVGAQGEIVPGSTMVGVGHQGESAGGMGNIEELARFTLKEFEIGNHRLGQTWAITRAHPPTLVGAGLLSDHIITLDYPNGAFIMEKRGRAAAPKAASYGIAYREGKAEVVQIYKGSKAEQAGLRLGDEIVAINDRRLALSGGDDDCRQVDWLINQFEPGLGARLRVRRDGQVQTIKVAKE